MANLYTKTGDKGQTSLVGGSRVSKGDLRVECYGTVDEMGAMLGYAKSLSSQKYIIDTIQTVQGRLFSFAAEIASDENGLQKLKHMISDEDVHFLENVVDECTKINGIQTSFVVPGKNPSSGALHVARTIVRRCERLLIRLQTETEVREVLLRYINRLSDATYALARLEETILEKEELRTKVEEQVRKLMTGMEKKAAFTLENIERMADRAKEKAAEVGISVVFAAVDEGGNLMLLHRMEGSFLGSIDVATNKAYTANAFKMSTDVLGKMAQPNEPLYGIESSNQGRIILFGGGIPYEYEGRVVGAIGVSGGTVEEDTLIAKYAIEQ
ncbi:MAG: cob(I)yrinic acid a,c-diamide adenosyltransferase [Hespellia sp.]|nr:cob(I)yrinic acid a,c-diamide adenosyltransferase [Hespellia sp.]